uniref:hypothetical protein n=1 Tax=Clostridium sp. NkU-1 TaxID=1095009 RepID=UPI000A5EA9E5
MKQLKENDIETRPIWQLSHTQRMYENSQAYFIEKAPFYRNRVINIPCSTSLLKKGDGSYHSSIEPHLAV